MSFRTEIVRSLEGCGKGGGSILKEPDLHRRAAGRNDCSRVRAATVDRLYLSAQGAVWGERRKYEGTKLDPSELGTLSISPMANWGKMHLPADLGKLLLMGLLNCREAYFMSSNTWTKKDQVEWVPTLLFSPDLPCFTYPGSVMINKQKSSMQKYYREERK